MLVMILVSPFVIVTSTQADQAPEVATVALTEWTIPTPGSKPRGLTLDPSGNCCWFVESDGNRVVHLDPTTHTFKEWTIPTPSSNATDLAATAVSGSVVIFGTESAKNKVFIFFPETGTFREYTLPTANSGPRRISIEPDGPQIKAWFTELGVPSSKYKRNSIGQIIYNPESRAVKLYELTLPTTVGGGANDVHALAETVWFAGRTAIVRWDKTTSRFTTWAIPFHASTEASFIDVDDLGEVWYTSTNPRAWSTDNYVGVLRGDDTFTEWQLAKLGAGIEGLSISPLARSPWIAESGGDRIARLDPSAGGIVTTAYPTTSKREPVDGGVLTTVTGPVLPSTLVVTPVASTISSEIVGHFTEWMLPAGSDPAEVVVDGSGEVWMLETATNKVARLSLSPNFIVECDSSSLLVAQGTDVTDMCRVTSVDGFASTVELAGSWVGAEPTGV
jgi:streptogramin lyase